MHSNYDLLPLLNNVLEKLTAGLDPEVGDPTFEPIGNTPKEVAPAQARRTESDQEIRKTRIELMMLNI